MGNVTVTGNPGYSPGADSETWRKCAPAIPYSVQRVSNALDRLRKRYQKQNRLLARVSMAKKSYREEANAVDYTFDIVPGPKVQVIAEGFKIKRGVLKQNVPIFEENAVDEDLLNEGRRNLLELSSESGGYFDAKIGMKEHRDAAGNELQIIYVIDPGARHRLDRIEFTGNKYFLTDQACSPACRYVQPSAFNLAAAIARRCSAPIFMESRTFIAPTASNRVQITTTVTDDYEGHENDLVLKYFLWMKVLKPW